MQPVSPELAGVRIVRLAEEQPEYTPIDAARVRTKDFPAAEQPEVAAVIRHETYGGGDNTHLLAFRLTEEERHRIFEGADIYVALLTYGGPMQPILVFAGKEQAAAAYGLRPARPGAFGG